MYCQRLSEAKRLLEQLTASPKYHFSDLKPSHLVDGLPVVYAIFDKETEETLYVGRTKNLRRRLYTNHLMGPRANARLKKYLTDDPAMPEIETMEQAKQYLKDRCYFQYIEESDMRRRGQVEGLLGFLLDVRYIHEEH